MSIAERRMPHRRVAYDHNTLVRTDHISFETFDTGVAYYTNRRKGAAGLRL